MLLVIISPATLLTGGTSSSAHISGLLWCIVGMLVLAGGVDSVMELVVVGASLPVAAGMVVSAVLFLSGEDDGTAMALSASGGLAALAANLWVAAKKGEIMLMEGCLAATECMLWVAGLMSARDPLGPSEPQDLSHVPLLLWGIFLAVSFVVSTNASIADHVLAQCSLFAAAMMVGCSFSLLSEEDVQGGSEFWGWLLVVMSLILVAAAKQQGKMMMVMTSLASFLSSAAWSVRILAGDGDVTDFQDGTLWVVVCWLLPSFALAANIVNNTADEREAAMVSATLAATVGMVYWAMHLLAPGDHPAVGFSSCMAIPVDRQCPRPAAVNIEHVAKSVEAQKIEQYVQTAKKSPAEAVKEVPSQRTSDEDRAEPVVPAVAEEEDVVSVDAVAEHASGEVTEEVIRDEAVQEVVEGSAVQNAEVEDSSALVDAVANEPVEEEPTAAAQEPAAQEPTIEVPMGEVPALEEATVEEAAAEESAAEDLMATVEAIAEEPREKATRRVEQDCTHSAENAEEIKFSLSASPGVWALVTSVPLVGKAAGSNHGGSLLAISTGAAAFLSIYMFECAFLYLAPEDAGPSVCFAPSLLVIALAVMFGCVLALPSGFSHIDAKVKLSSDDSEGGFMPLIFFCLFLTTVMTGCSVHHIAPEDLGAGACGPLIYFSRPARPVITRSCFDSLKTTAKATASRKFKTHDSAFAMARAQVEAELEARKSGMDPSAAAAHAQAEALKAHNAGPQVVAVPLAQPLVISSSLCNFCDCVCLYSCRKICNHTRQP